VFPVPDFSNEWAKKAFYSLINKAYRRKYWLITKDFTIMVNISRKNFCDFINATLSLLPKELEAREPA